ncbi:ubiquitin activating enzyme [Armillaria novae-zelandiae]|uniref:Ubiquitin activating enzyme n=1 Tax=Armillaria novae-zelandiae TaxID=153914 RepID=A0AA39PI22_9AGAR|nr:ubiquitin activating enzyme [Armillaria novae-zelandiae]
MILGAGATRTARFSPALPDMKVSTKTYNHLQMVYKDQFNADKEVFRSLIPANVGEIPDDLIGTFIRNTHGVQVIAGEQWGTSDKDLNLGVVTETMAISPKDTNMYLALRTVGEVLEISSTGNISNAKVSAEEIKTHIAGTLPPGTELGEEIDEAIGEIRRSPTADLPNTAAMLGGLVQAQEAIKMITRHVPQ